MCYTTLPHSPYRVILPYYWNNDIETHATRPFTNFAISQLPVRSNFSSHDSVSILRQIFLHATFPPLHSLPAVPVHFFLISFRVRQCSPSSFPFLQTRLPIPPASILGPALSSQSPPISSLSSTKPFLFFFPGAASREVDKRTSRRSQDGDWRRGTEIPRYSNGETPHPTLSLSLFSVTFTSSGRAALLPRAGETK